MNNFLKLAEPHLIFLIIIFLVVSYKIVISLLKATKNNTFDEDSRTKENADEELSQSEKLLDDIANIFSEEDFTVSPLFWMN